MLSAPGRTPPPARLPVSAGLGATLPRVKKQEIASNPILTGAVSLACNRGATSPDASHGAVTSLRIPAEQHGRAGPQRASAELPRPHRHRGAPATALRLSVRLDKSFLPPSPSSSPFLSAEKVIPAARVLNDSRGLTERRNDGQDALPPSLQDQHQESPWVGRKPHFVGKGCTVTVLFASFPTTFFCSGCVLEKPAAALCHHGSSVPVPAAVGNTEWRKLGRKPTDVEGTASFTLQEMEFVRLKEARMINFWAAAKQARDVKKAIPVLQPLEAGRAVLSWEGQTAS